MEEDKFTGAWFGMAVGDAMGIAVKGLKPETIAQCFKKETGYKDVRPFLGKGVKRYKMQGLYGYLTQSALAVCETLLHTRKTDPLEIARQLEELSGEGPENYLGVFRHPDSSFRRAVESLIQNPGVFPSLQKNASCGLTCLSIPLAIYYRDNRKLMLKACMETALMLSSHPWEVVGSAVAGFVTVRMAKEVMEDGPAKGTADQILAETAEFCEEAEAWYQKNHPDLWNEYGEKQGRALSRMFRALKENAGSMDHPNLTQWICANASAETKTKINNPTQGYPLTLLPLAAVMVLMKGGSFAETITESVAMGREAEKLGVLVGAWAGAGYGLPQIPQAWVSDLVNAREIRLRGEALVRRKGFKGKDLFQMEKGLTDKEVEDSRKFASKTAKKPSGKPASAINFQDADEEEGRFQAIKEDPYQLRKFQKDKTRDKRDRRRNIQKGSVDSDED